MSTIYLAELVAYIQASSASSVAIAGSGSKTFTLASPVTFVAGMTVTADAGSGNTMTGTVDAASTSSSLMITVTGSAGSGTHASWTIGGTTTLRYATGRGYNRPSASGFYQPRIEQPANFRRDIFSAGRLGGRSQTGYGELVLMNLDGVLDPLLEYGFDGRSLTLLIGDDQAAYGTFTTVLAGTMEQPEFTWDAVRFRIRDRQAELDKPIQPTKYAGSNSLPNGVEGVADDLKGLPKPICYGEVFEVTPPQVNTARRIFQANDRRVDDIVAVYERGLAFTKGTSRANLAALEATAPAAGQFDYSLGSDSEGAYFRLAADPIGQITADVKGDKRGGTYRSSVADIVQEIVVQRGGIASGDITSADITDLNTANSSAVGIWIGEERSISDVLDQLCASVGAWWGFDRTGKFRVQRLEAPSGSPVLTFRRFAQGTATTSSDADILTAERVATQDPGAGLPVWQVVLGYKPFWTVQAVDLDVTLSNARREALKQSLRHVSSSASSVQTKHLLAQQHEVETLLVSSSAAGTEADRVRDMLKVRRDRYRLTAKLDASKAGTLDLGKVVELKLPRFGLSAGKSFVVTGMAYNARTAVVELDLWG